LAVEQQDVERFKAMVVYVEESIERDERELDALTGREREYVYWRIRWRRRELKVLQRRVEGLEESLFAMSVLGDLKGL
jgi:hypothetical protein